MTNPEPLTKEWAETFTKKVRQIYVILFREFGLNKEKIRTKLGKLSQFFGHLGAIDELSVDELDSIISFLGIIKDKRIKL